MSGDRLIGEPKRVIEKEKPKEEIVLDKNIIFSLPKIPTILGNKYFEMKKEIKKQKDDKINEETDLTILKDEIDVREIPKEIELYFEGENSNFFQLDLNKDNENFIEYLPSEIGSQICRENILSMHIETGNIFYDNYNTNESIYSFLFNQPDGTEQITHATLTYKDYFSNYLKYFLDDIDNETVEKFDIFEHKNVKYLFYKFNDYLLFSGLNTVPVRHLKINENKTPSIKHSYLKIFVINVF